MSLFKSKNVRNLDERSHRNSPNYIRNAGIEQQRRDKANQRIDTILLVVVLSTLLGLLVAFILSITSTSADASTNWIVKPVEYSIYYNRHEMAFSTPPLNINGKTYIYMPDAASSFGVDWKWQNEDASSIGLMRGVHFFENGNHQDLLTENVE